MSGKRPVPLLVKILMALILCVGISSILTNLVETRLTRAALAGQSSRLAESDLEIVTQAYKDEDRTLLAFVGNLARELATRGLADPARRQELIGQLAISWGYGELDLLQVVDSDGRGLVAFGERYLVPRDLDQLGPDTGHLRPLPHFRGPAAVPGVSVDLNSRLLPASDGTYAQMAVASFGTQPDRLILGAGKTFGDAFAYRLRTRVGDKGEIVLVAGGMVTGSTLHHRSVVPPGARAESSPLPTRPTVINVDGVKSIVVYKPLAVLSDGKPLGVLGLVRGDPAASLDRSLARGRVVTSVVLGAVALVLGWILFRSLVGPLVGLANTATSIAGGDLSASFQVRGRDEIGNLGRSLTRMTDELRSQSVRITEVTRRIVTAQAEERHRIERDLHDGAQQRLLTASLAVGVAMASEAARGDARLTANLDEVARHLDLALGELRELARGIHPSILSEEGLGPALESLAEKSSVLVVISEPLTGRLPASVEATAYFIVSEAITNATKHARSSAVHVRASRRDGYLVVEVFDDGVGGADPVRGSGLVGLADRAAALGGRVIVESPIGRGTRVVAHLPCE